jgi:hypothetical protein
VGPGPTCQRLWVVAHGWPGQRRPPERAGERPHGGKAPARPGFSLRDTIWRRFNCVRTRRVRRVEPWGQYGREWPELLPATRPAAGELGRRREWSYGERLRYLTAPASSARCGGSNGREQKSRSPPDACRRSAPRRRVRARRGEALGASQKPTEGERREVAAYSGGSRAQTARGRGGVAGDEETAAAIGG